MFPAAKLDVDRYGVPQYSGEPELYEEYAEGAWDLYYGREGNEGQQAASPVHLRAGLSGAAYEAVRKLTHAELMTKDGQVKPVDKGMKLLLATLKDNIGPEKPVKVNELFFTAFYSPAVWRLQSESMQQYIIRREQDFKRLEDALAGAVVPTNLRAMMLLAFGGLDGREQLNVLSSVGNEYDLRKTSHALRIQFPACSGKPVYRKDYLGSRATGLPPSPPRQRAAPKAGRGKGKPRNYAMAAYEEAENKGDDACYEDEDPELYEEAYAEGSMTRILRRRWRRNMTSTTPSLLKPSPCSPSKRKALLPRLARGTPRSRPLASQGEGKQERMPVAS